MPRYVVERTFDGALPIPEGHEAAEACRQIVGRNTDQGVTWVHSYVSAQKDKFFCVYDAPSPEAIRKTAALNGLPVDSHHASQRARPVPVPVKEENKMKRSLLIVGSLVAAVCVAALVVASASAKKPATPRVTRTTAALAPRLAAARLATAKYVTTWAGPRRTATGSSPE